MTKCWICGKKVQSMRVHLINEVADTFIEKYGVPDIK